MRWYNKMYLGKSIQGKKMYYQYAIQHTKRLTGTYCLMPAACKDDLIDICGTGRRHRYPGGKGGEL